MCGRYYFDLDGNDKQIIELRQKIEQLNLFDVKLKEIFPSQKAYVLLSGDTYKVGVKSWGIKGYNGNQLINARMEGIESKRTFSPFLKQRCLIPCNGFYEWIKNGSKKDKIFVQKKQRPLLYLAGIYNDVDEFVILTGESQGKMANVHKRTPLIIGYEEIDAFLSQDKELSIDNENLIFQKV